MSLFRRIAVISAAAISTLALLAAPATASPLYTATSCSGHSSSGQCLYSGANGGGSVAWDASGKSNFTLNQWDFYNTSTEIANHISSITRYKTSCYVTYYTGTQMNGDALQVKPGNTYSFNLSGTEFYHHVYSFSWSCD